MAIRWSPKCNTTAAIMAVGDGNAAGAAAAGAAAGMFLGIMMATEAQREQAVEYRAQRFAAIPPAGAYLGRDGVNQWPVIS
jgi:hypothetical protein